MTSYLVIAFTSSFCSMSFSMIMALLMSEFTGEEVLTQCLTLGPYLLGLGAGSFLGDRVPEERQLTRLFQIEWLSVILLPVIPLLQLLGIFVFINLSPLGLTPESPLAQNYLLGLTAILAFGSGILGGSQLPMILNVCRSIRSEVILAINYLGPLFAGILVVVLSGLALGFGVQIYLIGLVQLVGLFFLLQRLPKRTLAMVSLSVPLLVLFLAGKSYPELETWTVKSAYMNTRANGWRDLLSPGPLLKVLDKYGLLQRVRTAYQTIDFFVEPGAPDLGIPGNSTLYLNRKPQFDLYSVEVYHETMVDGAINLLGKTPSRVLILGAGDGLLLRELRDHPGIEEIVMVELDQKMLQWASENTVISQLNDRVLENPPKNARVLTMDAVSFLRNNKANFELILVDFPFPNGQELAKLYSREFYTLVGRSLSPEGLVMVDLPLYLDRQGKLSRESRTILKTMDAAGFKNRLLMGPNASFVAIKTGGEKLRFHYERFPKELSLAASLNLVAPFDVPQFDASDKINTLFWPGGL